MFFDDDDDDDDDQSRRKDPPYPPVGGGSSRLLRGLMLGRVKIFWARADGCCLRRPLKKNSR